MHNVKLYSGTNPKPDWNPELKYSENTMTSFDKDVIAHYSNYAIYTFENAFSEAECNELIKSFDEQKTYAVGVDGYVDPNEKAGSYRAMAWSESVADNVSQRLYEMIDEKWFNGGLECLSIDNETISMHTPFQTEIGHQYKLIGSTPWLRFMKYASGGMHTPHYDAPFKNDDERYITLFSWVLYLNTPDGDGGSFQFIDDGQQDVHPSNQNLGDWDHMSDNVILDIKPECGKLLVFPHWLCHQVEEYLGEGYRYIIRGDVAYSIE